ncbi:AraC family transcriptional regulator [Photobacterium aquae]|uniref:AraC family transcriptional regulator n=1 Tax=Photobacterium aquae TaxID=1195763 RepID=A0A0J1JTC6_9GAMM|nr:helix-turn-helix domain-containing protein [Photobacterium aquae]KLV05537.1 AraC family transcriptional regulator [Photobacterium aquae]
MTTITIAICHYPSALRSAIYGLDELFMLANRVCKEHNLRCQFVPTIIETFENHDETYQIVILPPSMSGDYYRHPNTEHIQWLNEQHRSGSKLASACAGSFILAHTDTLQCRAVTTHWGLADDFRHTFPNQPLDIDRILIDHGDIVTAGGMMSWLDLGLDIIAKHAGEFVMRQLGKMLVVDTAPREQRYYQQFIPLTTHNDHVIRQVQQHINLHYSSSLTVTQLASLVHLSERSLLRRFRQATHYSPNEYLQRLRIQKACDLLEASQYPFEHIAHLVGYQDSTACRKTFIKIMGLTPRAFRQRFNG